MPQECEETKCPAGIPAWVLTFADLMSLLLCFFILLLSFATMDAKKFKAIAGSLKEAFGVQSQIKAEDIPKGVSLIALEYSPGTPEPSIMDDVRQKTTEEEANLDVKKEDKTEDSKSESDSTSQQQLESMAEIEEAIEEAMEQELENDQIEIVTDDDQIILRIKDKASFPSASAILNDSFATIVDKIRTIVKKTDGNIVIAGHTDDIPISTLRYRSNWALSASRATSVLHAILEDKSIDPTRFRVEGYANAQPLDDKKSKASRSINRRVEIVFRENE